MTTFRVLESLPIARLAEQWDSLASLRLKQILTGSDITFNFVICPTMFDLLRYEGRGSVLDAGCGVGVFTSYLSNSFKQTTGIDPSPVSVSLALKTCDDDVELHVATIEEFSRSTRRRFDVITASMVLMDAPFLDHFCRSVYSLLKPGGSFVFSMTHPAFWPEYYGYKDMEWFQYDKEIIVESPFRISSDPDGHLVSTHIHRPLSFYVEMFADAGLYLERLLEPVPDSGVQALYPQPWSGPRYILGRCRRPRRL